MIGVSYNDFWNMTPNEFKIYIDGYNEGFTIRDKKEDTRMASLMATIANFSMASKKHNYKTKDFMSEKKIGIEAMLEEVKRMNALFGGEVRRA